jgi:hypothetical protein
MGHVSALDPTGEHDLVVATGSPSAGAPSIADAATSISREPGADRSLS